MGIKKSSGKNNPSPVLQRQNSLALHGHWQKVILSHEMTRVTKPKSGIKACEKLWKMDKSVFRCLPCWSEEHTQTDGLWSDVLLTMVSVRWCLWQEI